MRKLLLVVTLVTVVALALSSTAAAANVSVRAASLTGAAEFPGPGDPEGIGAARVAFVLPHGLVCWRIAASGIGPVVGAHIHSGVAGTAGPIVIDFNGRLTGCTRASRSLIAAIVLNSSAFYVNVHTAEFPAGAIRGQLTGGFLPLL